MARGMVGEAAAIGGLAPDLRLFALTTRLLAQLPFLNPAAEISHTIEQGAPARWLVLGGPLVTLIGRLFAMVGSPLSLVGDPVALIGDLIALIGHLVALVRRLITGIRHGFALVVHSRHPGSPSAGATPLTLAAQPGPLALQRLVIGLQLRRPLLDVGTEALQFGTRHLIALIEHPGAQPAQRVPIDLNRRRPLLQRRTPPLKFGPLRVAARFPAGSGGRMAGRAALMHHRRVSVNSAL